MPEYGHPALVTRPTSRVSPLLAPSDALAAAVPTIPVVMLKITLHDSAGELRFRLEGRLSGAWVRTEGSYTLPQEQLPEIQTAEGQGFDEASLADDRDTILSKYFDNGFPNATVDVAYIAAPAGPD